MTAHSVPAGSLFRRVVPASLALAALLCCVPARAVKVAAPEAGGVELAGKVLGPDGRALAGAAVRIGARSAPVKTDARGAFTVKVGRRDGAHDVYVVSADRRWSAIARLKAGTRKTEIRLKPGIEVRGLAVGDDGKPAAGLRFFLSLKLNGQPLRSASHTTGADGKFVATNLCAGAVYTARWYAGGGMNAGYVSGSAQIQASKGSTPEIEVKRFLDDWNAPGHIAVSPQTKCGRLTNYCLDGDDNVLACDGAAKRVRKISPQDKLLADWKLGFAPQAIDCRADGTVVVAGAGKMALLARDGRQVRVESLPGKSKTATSVACSGRDVFVAVRIGTKYAIYRTDDRFREPRMIVKGLRGCCGQMDFTAREGVIYVAANCKFKVLKYDRDGKATGEFGRRTRGKKEGFDGCCEPKNVCFDAAGNLYTSESGKCRVKKFTPAGKFLAHMGRVSGIRGCVRVTIALPKDGSRIYMLDTSRNIIRLVKPEKPAKRDTKT